MDILILALAIGAILYAVVELLRTLGEHLTQGVFTATRAGIRAALDEYEGGKVFTVKASPEPSPEPSPEV